MIKTLLLTIILLAAATGAAAAPYLVCDPQAGVVHYEVMFNDNVYEAPAEEDGSIKWELEDVLVGEHTVRLRAANIYGDWSTWSDPFVFRRDTVTPPSGMRLSTH